MKGTAKLIKTLVFKDRMCPGYRQIYRIQESDKDYFYLAADFSELLDNSSETMVFACSRNGEIANFTDLWYGVGDFCKDHVAIKELGYEIEE